MLEGVADLNIIFRELAVFPRVSDPVFRQTGIAQLMEHLPMNTVHRLFGLLQELTCGKGQFTLAGL